MLLLDELLSHFRNLCILSATNSDFSLIPAGSGTRNDLARQTKEFTLGEIMRCMDILQDCIARTPKTAKRKTVAEMCLIRLCTPRLDSDTSALSLRLEKLENRLDKLCDGEISIQPKTAVQTGESTEKHIPAQSAKPVSVTGDRPQDIADTLNRIENKITSADDKQKDVTAPTAPVQQSGTERNAADNKPDWLFEGTGGADENASTGNEDALRLTLTNRRQALLRQSRNRQAIQAVTATSLIGCLRVRAAQTITQVLETKMLLRLTLTNHRQALLRQSRNRQARQTATATSLIGCLRVLAVLMKTQAQETKMLLRLTLTNHRQALLRQSRNRQ